MISGVLDKEDVASAVRTCQPDIGNPLQITALSGKTASHPVQQIETLDANLHLDLHSGHSHTMHGW